MEKRKRRKYLIDIRIQGPFLLKAGAICAAGTLLLCVLLYYLADEEIGRNFYSVHLRIRNTWQVLLPAVLVSGGTSFFLTVGALVLLAIRESHRLGGPIFKFNQLFSRLESGYFGTDFRFRHGDLLFGIGESYRAALQANRDRIAVVQERAREAEALSRDLHSKLLLVPLPPEERAVLEETRDAVARLSDAAQAFDTGAA